jgi:metaxin
MFYRSFVLLQVLSSPTPATLKSVLLPPTEPTRSSDATLTAPAAPLFGFSTLLYTKQNRVDASAVQLQYREAISALGERLGTDEWFLGSRTPTFLDALVFAYLHRLLRSPRELSFEVERWANLVAWENRVAKHVRASFERAA